MLLSSAQNYGHANTDDTSSLRRLWQAPLCPAAHECFRSTTVKVCEAKQTGRSSPLGIR